jgi:tetratricopeptide (TPR) repeat protein
LDICPLRIPSNLERELQRVTQEKGVALIPYKRRIEELAVAAGNMSGIPGNECFLDHVHPTIEGHQALAQMIFSHLVRHKLFHPAKTLDSSDIQNIFTEGMSKFDSKFFALRDLNLAKTLKWAGKTAEARSALERAAGNFPESAEIQKMLGSYFLEEGKFKDAIKAYSSAVDLSGKDPQMLFSLAVAQSKSGNRLEAENLYSAILNSDSPIPEAYANLAILYLEQGRISEAGTILDRGMSKVSNAQALYSPRAVHYAIKGDAVQALSWMQKAVEAEPGDPANYYNLAGIFVMMGRNEEAVSALETAVNKGYANISKIQTDPMLNSVRNTEKFKAFMKKLTSE